MADPGFFSRRALLGHGIVASVLLPSGWLAAHAGSPQPASPGATTASRAAPRAKPPLVMLDPGHGGKDPGAIGVSGTHEKSITLAAALELRRQLRAGGHYRVELTRVNDVFVPLAARVARAQASRAALFVSIHADALDNEAVRGASVYTLAEAASDAQTAALARRENAADRFAGPGFRDQTPEVARILASLVRQETRAGSARIAASLVASLDRALPMLERPARHAGFMVLKAADVPSVLVEMGFLSNRADEAALRQPQHRARVAAAMKRAVDGFFATTAHMPLAAG